MTAETPAGGPPAGRRVRWPAFLAGVRSRIVLGAVLVLAIGAVVTVLVARQALIVRLDERIAMDLSQETEELRRLAGGVDPTTGQPFGADAEAVFTIFLQRNIPGRNEAFITFVDRQPFLRSRAVTPYRLDQDASLISLWGGLTDTRRGRVSTPAGGVDYQAVPLVADGAVRGVFVVAVFRDRVHEGELDGLVLILVAVGGALVILGSLVAWLLSSRLLRSVEQVTLTARSITDAQLSRRIKVAGRDEVALLAETFNQMLDRLQGAFQGQRRLLDDVGHELRTPITIVRGHLELLGDDPQERRETVALVTDELDRMVRMVNDLILLARSEQPDFLRLEPVDVESLAIELRDKAEALGPRRWALESGVEGEVLADRQRLTQAVMQLAENACRHTSDGDPIAIGTAQAVDAVRFYVRDSGPGVAPSDQERIFERFARGRRPARADSTGLGLSIVRAIAEGHRGRAELESPPGEGATFSIVIPRADRTEDPGPQPRGPQRLDRRTSGP